MTSELLPLDEAAGWLADEPERITAVDVWAAECDALAAELAAADDDEETRREIEDCCGGRNFWCVHYRRYHV